LGITYSNTEDMRLFASAADNVINISSTSNLIYRIDGGAGNDSINLTAAFNGATLNVAGGEGTDAFNYLLPSGSTANVTYAGGAGSDTLNVNSGTFTLNQDAALSSADLNVNVNGRGTLVMNSSQHLAALKIQSGGRATLSTNGARILVLNQLDASGKLDLANNDLIVQATDVTRLDMLAAIESRIRNAYNTTPTHWQGDGITSSTAAATASGGLGVLLYSPEGAGYTQIDGQTLDANSIIVRYTLIGDLNLDRSVSISDMIGLASNFGQAGSWSMGDMNYDGAITISDFIDLAANFNQSFAATSVIVEPSAAESLVVTHSKSPQTTGGRLGKTLDAKQSLPVRRNEVHHRHRAYFRWSRR